ncbi:ABC transporter permease subunit [Rubrobacter tropicus]|uniref:ABC transporter permease subunit n=1 Tax=Rubrobacter tropicus TaxID=2653851 RepID=A0A6G8QEM0_9ACTN|nr:ABC transporter permease [Rubrobacter tropicus]QIN84888.1 ABC transporter permease subunit [Rubrobacter tropicus]
MIAKEWRDARWKFLIGVVAFLILIPTVSSYEAIKEGVQSQIDMMQRDLRSPEKILGPVDEQEQRRFVTSERNEIRNMQDPAYVEQIARWQLRDLTHFRNVAVIVPLAGLFGIGLVAGEVGRGSIFLLLSKPVGRTRMLLTKYAVCATCLFVIAAIGGGSIILTAFARGYPPEAVQVSKILLSTGLTYLGSLFVLGVALIMSVIFRDILRTLLATVASVFVILAGPDLLRALVEWIVWGDRLYTMGPMKFPPWYRSFDHFRLYDYWIGLQPYSGEMMAARSLVVCVVTATAALLLALWLFRRRAY